MTADDLLAKFAVGIVGGAFALALSVIAFFLKATHDRAKDTEKTVQAHALQIKGLEVEQSGTKQTLAEIKERVDTIAQAMDLEAVREAVSDGVARALKGSKQ